mmetsp:Transcript_12356/g.39111  ORF Transcript_12356/g.39111 Transcript_12356/m.39111 type:complete len:142 (-) Transcript_12356:53-478(-)|eukprot:CAMPEP_0170745218 /NCGR_PEP_ID=MMETSP0437-20130122/8182_1 /TAXON_ID=0 /ORGANISM="Sexangularia sp." /LENGTH=141 /DNA_ID=CAMNT_0011083935 /DNA_START=60 /DNA_END=485 /DNA_ORIENTATION=+
MTSLQPIRPSEDEDMAEGKLGVLSGATPLFNAEVVTILQQMKDNSVQQSEAFEKSFVHAEQFRQFTSDQAVRQVRQMLTEARGPLSGLPNEQQPFLSHEIALLCNLTPEEPEEAIALIPTLVRFDESWLQQMCDEILAISS